MPEMAEQVGFFPDNTADLDRPLLKGGKMRDIVSSRKVLACVMITRPDGQASEPKVQKRQVDPLARAQKQP